MSANSNTDDSFAFDPSGDSTVLRITLSPEQAAELLRSHAAAGKLPPIDLLDEIHVLISDRAIERAYADIPRPDLELESFVSPLLSDPVFVSTATSLMGLNRLFTGLSAVLLDKGIVEPEDLRDVIADLRSVLDEDTEPSGEILRKGIHKVFTDHVAWLDEYTAED